MTSNSWASGKGLRGVSVEITETTHWSRGGGLKSRVKETNVRTGTAPHNTKQGVKARLPGAGEANGEKYS